MKNKKPYTKGEIYGSICCYEYQSCETPDWNSSTIYYTLQNLKREITEALLEENGDPMVWGIK